MIYILHFLRKALPYLIKYGPILFVITLIISSSAIEAYNQKDPAIFFRELGIRVLASDYKVQENVKKLKEEGTSLPLFFDSIGSVMVLLYIIMLFTKFFRAISGTGGALLGYLITSLLLLSASELLVVYMSEGTLTVPFKGLYMFFINFPLFVKPIISELESTGVMNQTKNLTKNLSNTTLKNITRK